ncbi:M56 family metallopeptidase [Flavobacterium sp. xlx-214]|uniref:M56 family metallopeptidase n=1 Tax=unclassified Flavobacterium TaxID=196869 RepID=UPI0013D88ACF|nr:MULTISPECIES: M56 family metallopeptidase [unclassified Flavobacterium]MBA5792867.1 M56 family metallopeptidase [Flavobacterium sp. xlx-221]QMI84798.1 M56 family metallopeptidase [Flavobacterium sp. xlx-214]
MILYLLKSSFLLLVLLLIYKWSLENKKSLQFNRFYLLFSLLLGFLLPLLNFSFKVESNTVLQAKEVIVEQLPAFIINIEEEDNDVGFMWYEIVYYSVTTLLFFKFIFHAFTFYRLKRTGTIVNSTFGQLVLNNNIKVPFSFYKYIYLNKNDWNSNTIDDAILYHEQGHIIQKHSLDIILLELLSVFLWFQPFIYYFKRLIQENHEYLADEYSLNKTKNIKHYQHLILNCYSHKQSLVPLSSSIHFNNLKKRFIMMKNTKKGRVWETVFYSFTLALTYVGLVGIEAKATEIKNVEAKVTKIIEQSAKQSDEIVFTEPIREESKNEIKNDSIILAYIKGEKSSGYFNYNDSVYFYVVDENLKVSIYNRYGVVQNEKDFTYELKAVSKAEKEKLTLDELKKSSQVQNDYQDRKEIEKAYAEAHSFVEKKATPREGLSSFMSNFAKEFKAPENINTNEIKMRLKFIVETDGSFSNIFTPQEYFKPDESYVALQEEAIRTLKTMPNWSPAENEGKIIRSTFTLPITIKVNPSKIDIVN